MCFELQQAFEAFSTSPADWMDEDPAVCRCHGSGWAVSPVDTWHTCPIHYAGQMDPESRMDIELFEAAHEGEPTPITPTPITVMPQPFDPSDDDIPF